MRVSTAGDLGDVIFLLGVLAYEDGGPNHLYLFDDGHTRGVTQHVRSIASLSRLQNYIHLVEVRDGGGEPEWRSEEFRHAHHEAGNSLIESLVRHGVHCGALPRRTINPRGWINTPSTGRCRGRVVVARSPRYNNPYFPWARIRAHYGDRLIFVGYRQEWENFRRDFGAVDYLEADDLSALAAHISSAELFIGNQSCPLAIAEGVGARIIQETCLFSPDCIYPRPLTQFVADGCCVLPAIGDSGVLSIAPNGAAAMRFEDDEIEGVEWAFAGCRDRSVARLAARVIDDMGLDRELAEVERVIQWANVWRTGGDYLRTGAGSEFNTVYSAFEKAASWIRPARLDWGLNGLSAM